jgi:hypothetical protein
MEFMEGDARLGHVVGDARMNAGDMSMLTVVICSGRALCGNRSVRPP